MYKDNGFCTSVFDFETLNLNLLITSSSLLRIYFIFSMHRVMFLRVDRALFSS